MSLFTSKKQRPEPLEWGSSFATAEVANRRKYKRAMRAAGYDEQLMTYNSEDSGQHQRPIGSRKKDIVSADSYLSGNDIPPRRKHSIFRRLLNLLLLLVAVAVIAGIGWGVWNFVASNDVQPGKNVTIKIPSGATSSKIARILADAEVVNNVAVFRAKLKMSGDGADFKSGVYRMKTGSSYNTIVRVLERGPAAAPTFNLTLPEGQRLEEVAATIDRLHNESLAKGGKLQPAFTGAEYMKAARSIVLPAEYGAPLKPPVPGAFIAEGFLFPAMYELKLSATAQDLIDKQLEAFSAAIKTIDLTRAKKANLSIYDVVTIASLVEREAKLAKERPLVAAVIWNRMKIGEPLGIDASNQYSVYKKGSKEFWVKQLKQSDLDKDSPYNLRKVQGLPPTPIASPGLASLQAAANPAKVDYRYYVANPNGSGEHFFTNSYDEFLAHPFQRG